MSDEPTTAVEAQVLDSVPLPPAIVQPRPTGLPALKTTIDVDHWVEERLLEWSAYQKLTEKLLDDSDYQKIGKTKFKKKSAWRKYARAFNISCEKISEEINRADDGYPAYVRIVIRATAPDGRIQDGDQECHITERCCQEPCSKRSWDRHSCCSTDCNGRKHFSHPGDLPATAFTRAKNRAISDLIGAGEVSAEEMADDGSPAKAQAERAAAKPRPKSTDQGQVIGKLRHGAGVALTAYQRQQGDAAYWELTERLCPEALDDNKNVRVALLTKEQCEAILAEPAEQPLAAAGKDR